MVVGAGFLAPRGVIVTCAHVINDALNRDKLCTERPRDEIPLDLPWADGLRYHGTVIDWRPPVAPGSRQGEACVDIAVLAIDGSPSAKNAVLPQPPTGVPDDTTFKVMGFPAGADAGAPARGSVRGTDAGGWHHVEPDRSYGRTIELGFSGAPAIADGPNQRLLGMIDITNPDERRGVLIPVTALMRAWPPLAEPYRGWRLVRIRPGERPIAHLARELVAALEPDIKPLALADEAAKLQEALNKQPTRLLAYGEACYQATGCGLCIVVDQFEETFTLARPTNPDQHRALLAALANLANQRDSVSIRAVLGLRSDFQSLLQSDEAVASLVDAVNGEPTVMLRAMVAAERERAILGPIDTAHLDVGLDNGLLGQIMDEIANNPDALPLLEFALTELWQRIEIDTDGRRLTADAYDKIGGVTGALARHADDLLHELNVDERQVRRLFIELVRVSDTIDQDARRPRSKAELDALDPALWLLAQRLAEKRLVVTTGEPAVDIVHEALFRRWDRLSAWIAEERDFLRWRQRLDERRREWKEAGQDSRDLLNGRALKEAEPWLAQRKDGLSQQQLFFIQASQDSAFALAAREQVDRLWNRLELSWPYQELGDDECKALAELQNAAPAVRHEFLISTVTDEPRARRLCRQSNVVLRAVFALDVEQAKIFANKLSAWLGQGEPLGPARALAVLLIAGKIVCLEPSLASRALVFATTAIGGTTDSTTLEAYAEAMQALARVADAAVAQEIIERVAEAIAETSDGPQLLAYAKTIHALAGLANAAACTAATANVEQAVAGIAGANPYQWRYYAQVIQVVAHLAVPADTLAAATTIVEQAVTRSRRTSDWNVLRECAETIRALAGLVNTTAARISATAIFEQAATAIVMREADSNDRWSLVRTIQILAGLVDAAVARRLIEEAAAAIKETTDRAKLYGYIQTLQALAGAADASVACKVIELAPIVIAQTKDGSLLGAYAQAIEAVASHADAGVRQKVIEAMAVAIPGTTDEDQLLAYAWTIQAIAGPAPTVTAHSAAMTILEIVAPAIARVTYLHELVTPARTIEALAGLVDPAIARTASLAIAQRVLGFLTRSRSIYNSDILADAFIAIRCHVPIAAWTLAAIEILKHPLFGATESLFDYPIDAFSRQ